MTEAQQQNLDDIINTMIPAIEDKYFAGTEEHKTNLADLPDRILMKELINEVYDLFVYVGEAKRRGLL